MPKRSLLVSDNLFQRIFGNSREIKKLETELKSLRGEMEENSIDSYIEQISAYDKSTDDSGFPVSNNYNYHSAIEQDIAKVTLHRLYVSEGWMYIAVTAIAKTIASLPFVLEKQVVTTEYVDASNPDAGTIRADSWVDANGEPEHEIFQYPNSTSTAIEFYMMIIIDLLSTGEAFIYIDRGPDAAEVKNAKKIRLKQNQNGVKGLYRMNSSAIEPIVEPGELHIQGYAANTAGGYFKFETENIIHIRLPNPVDPTRGLSPIVPVMKNILLDRYTTEHMIRFYKQGARLGGAIETDKKLSKDQITRLQRSFEQDFTGRQNHHRTLILPEGMKYRTIEQNPGETSLIEFNKQNREPVLSAYGLPPIKAGILDGASFANALTQEKSYYQDTIKPLLEILQQSLNLSENLIAADRKIRIRFDMSGVEALQENETEKSSTAASKLSSGMTINEVRREVWGLPPVDGGDRLHPSLSAPEPPPMLPMPPPPDTSGKGIGVSSSKEIMDIVKAFIKGDITLDAAVMILGQACGIDQAAAYSMLGHKEKINIPQNTTPSDVVPTTDTFEARVAQLISIMVQDGVEVAVATRAAIERAILEGFVPSAPIETVGDDGDKDGEWNPVAVGDNVVKPPRLPSYDDEDDSDLKQSEIPERYAPINFEPSDEISKEASQGLTWAGEYSLGTESQKARATKLKDKAMMTPQSIKTMASFFSRNDENRGYEEDDKPKPGEILWKLYGGDSGQAWANETYESMLVIDDEEIKSLKTEIPYTKEFLDTYRKGLTEENIKDILELREEEVVSFFERVSKLFLDQARKHFRLKGGKYIIKAEESPFDAEKINKFIEEEAKRNPIALRRAHDLGYDNTLEKYPIDIDEKKTTAALKNLARLSILSVVATTEDDVTRMIFLGTSEGDSAGKMRERLTEYFQGSKTLSRIQTIVRTESLMSVSLGQDLKTQSLKKEYPELATKLRKVWITAQDERVRGNPGGIYPDSEFNHFVLDGVVIDETKRFPSGLRYPRDPGGKAGNIINCFLPGTEVSGIFIAGVKSDYTGPAIEIKTESGRKLRVTTNHKILTKRGWLAAKDINGFDEVISYKTPIDSALVVGEINKDNKPSLVENVFKSLLIDGESLRRDLRANDLNGDSEFINGSVNVVISNSLLFSDGKSVVRQKINDTILKQKLMSLSNLSGFSSSNFSGDKIDLPAPSVPGRRALLNDSLSIVFDSGPLQGLGFRRTSLLESKFIEVSDDRNPADPVFIREFVNRESDFMFFDKVIEINLFDYCGHVYDLQSLSGCLMSDGVLTHNCRCTHLVFVSEDEDDVLDSLGRSPAKGGPGSGCRGPSCGRPRGSGSGDKIEEVLEAVGAPNPKGGSSQAAWQLCDPACRYTEKRAALHNQTVARTLRDGKKGNPPIAILTAGGGGAGKSTTMQLVLTQFPQKFVHLDSDKFKKELPEYRALTKAKNPKAASFVHEESSDLVAKAFKESITKNKNLIYDSTFSNPDKATNIITRLKSEGYKVHLVYTDVPAATAIERAAGRANRSGRSVPLDVLKKAHAGAILTLNKVNSLPDTVTVFSNIGKTPKIAYQRLGPSETVINNLLLNEMKVRGHSIKALGNNEDVFEIDPLFMEFMNTWYETEVQEDDDILDVYDEGVDIDQYPEAKENAESGEKGEI